MDEASSFGEAEAPAPDQELRWATQAYARRPAASAEAAPDAVDAPRALQPHEATVLLFPGQGAQRVGMGRQLGGVPAAKELYELASQVVGWDVWRVCTEGPEEELQRRCQTAVLVTALAALERVRDERPAALERVRAAAGFSLGEVAALTWAGALHLEAALRLVELRAAAMRAAAAERPGGMLTVWLAPAARLPLAMLRAREHAAANGLPDAVCQVANYMYPGCKVIAGDQLALQYIEKSGKEYGVKRCARVRVEGAFHTPLMAPAEAAVRQALRDIEVRPPRVPVYEAAAGRPYAPGPGPDQAGGARGVRRGLARHVTRPVRWEQTLHALFARPPTVALPLTLALGPGGALRATLRQVNARAWDSSLQVDV